MPHQYLPAEIWPALALPLFALSLVGLKELAPQAAGALWPRLQSRKERRARELASRLHGELCGELDRLKERNERLRVHIEEAKASQARGPLASMFGPDLLFDMHDQAIATLREWVDLAIDEAHELPARQLESRCQALADLTKEANMLKAEIEAREAAWERQGRPWVEGLKAKRGRTA